MIKALRIMMAIGLIVMLVTTGVVAQEDLTQTVTTAGFVISAPEGWFVGDDSFDDTQVLLYLFESEATSELFFSVFSIDALALAPDARIVFIRGALPFLTAEEELADQTQNSGEGISFSAVEPLTIGDYSGFASRVDAGSVGEGVAWVLDISDELQLNISALTPVGELEGFLPLLEAIIGSVAPIPGGLGGGFGGPGDGDFDFGDGDFSFDPEVPELDFEPTPLGTLLTYGDSIFGFLTDEVGDDWEFEGSAGDTVTIVMTPYRSSSIDTYLELYDATGTLLAGDDDGFIGLSSQIEAFELPADGTYTIRATSFGGSGRGGYRLVLSDTTGFLIGDDRGAIEVGQAITTQLETSGIHIYTLNAEGGTFVRISLEAQNNLFDTFLQLRDADGVLIEENDDFNGLNSQITAIELPPGDTFYLIVTSYNVRTGGDYTVSVELAG